MKLLLRIATLLRAPALRFLTDRRANISLITAITAPVLLGMSGLGLESALWQGKQRGMQNAADAAALAAATNASGTFASEAKAVAAKYGFVDGQGNVAIVASNAAPCPAGGNTCYSVSISGAVPLVFSAVVGFKGDKLISGTPHKAIAAAATASYSAGQRHYCMLALAGSGAKEGIRTNGASSADLAGCNIMSNTGARCNGHDLNADIADAAGLNNGCGVSRNSNAPTVDDPYIDRAVNIPADPCTSYPQAPIKKNDPALPAANLWTGTVSIAGNKIVCGDLQLTGDTIIDAPSGGVLVIENGRLDTNGFKLKTANGSGLTVVFSGSNSGGYTHAPTGGGILDIAAPTTGPWKGVALYQDPKLTSGVDISAAGSSPTWNITGLVYLPHATVQFSGAVNKASFGQACFVLVVDNVTVNGTAAILNRGGCPQAGLEMPSTTTPTRPQLVA